MVLNKKLTWHEIYNEAELYKSAVRLYTNPVFNYRKAASVSTDNRTFYDFARRGLHNINSVHRELVHCKFSYRPGAAFHCNFNGKERTLYIYPWAEKLVDQLIYRLLNRYLDSCFYGRSYAYRIEGFGIDRCQKYVGNCLLYPEKPVYIIKRDIRDYFNSVNHEIMSDILGRYIERDDYLFRLVMERVQFKYSDNGTVYTANRGIPFGTPAACILANIYLTPFDFKMKSVKGIKYIRYCDDIIIVAIEKPAAEQALLEYENNLAGWKLQSKPGHSMNLIFKQGPAEINDGEFLQTDRIRHLGLEFRADGRIRLSRDKFRKISNLFRYAFRRNRNKLKRIKDTDKRLAFVIEIVNKTILNGVRNVAIIDYYLKHVNDENQLQLLDRWLAEECISIVLGNGHKKSNFNKISYSHLRKAGLPSLLHRRRLILHGYIESPFFIWKMKRACKQRPGMVARFSFRQKPESATFSSIPEAAAH